MHARRMGRATRFPRSGRLAGVSEAPQWLNENVNFCAGGIAAGGAAVGLATKRGFSPT